MQTRLSLNRSGELPPGLSGQREWAMMKAMQGLRSFGRWCLVGVLVVATLLSLQFALQAWFSSPPQALLVLLTVGAFGTAAFRVARHRPVAQIIFLTTLPLFVFSVAATFIYPDESPIFAIVFGVAPVISGIAWKVRSK